MSTAQQPARVLPRFVRPLQEFLGTEAAGGVLLMTAAIAAMVWANLPGESYFDFWGTHVVIDADLLEIDLSLQHWVNDALMAVFFFVVGMEIKREVVKGELADRRKAVLPVAAALGGMAVPAAIYLALNAGGDGERGWGIPMATDIAFAVGILALLGRLAPLPLKVFVLALAIADDIGAIMVIALFYTDDLSLGWLAVGTAALAGTAALGRAKVRDLTVYGALALLAWLGMYESGIHPTIAGVALGLLTPLGPLFVTDDLEARTSALLSKFHAGGAERTREGAETANTALRELEELARESQSPLDRLEHALHPWTSYAIVPVFALANAGVELGGGALGDALSSRIGLGVAFGLLIGKPLGILLFSAVSVRAGIGALPEGVTWQQLAGAGLIAGVGFTVSIFISALAFDAEGPLDDAKLGIVGGSILASILGAAVMLAADRRRANGNDTTPERV